MDNTKQKLEDPLPSTDNGNQENRERSAKKRPCEDSPQAQDCGGKRIAIASVEPRVRARSTPPPPLPNNTLRHQDRDFRNADRENADLRAAAMARLWSDENAAAIRDIVEELNDACYESESDEGDDDPLLSDVPSHLDPERLGFLVCAQETLRYLYRRGIHHHHPIFVSLRSRFIRGLNEMGLD